MISLFVHAGCHNNQFTTIILTVRFLLGNSPVFEFYTPMFRNTLSVPSSWTGRYEEWLGLRNVGIFIWEKVWPKNTPTFLKPSHTSYLPAYEDGTDSVPKCLHIKFRRRGITQKKAYNIWNMAKVWNQDYTHVPSKHCFMYNHPPINKATADRKKSLWVTVLPNGLCTKVNESKSNLS